MNHKKRISPYAGMALICALALLGACGNPAGDDDQPLVPITELSLDRDIVNLTPGGTYTFVMTYAPADATETGVSWESSNTAAATVENGTVTAVSIGAAVITARSATNSGISASCVVMVTNPVPLTGITLDRGSLNLTPGGTNTLTVIFNPPNTTQPGITWSSSNTNVARVLNGTVTALAVGQATITAKSAANNSITASCAVTVTAVQVPLTGITLNTDSLNLNPDGQGNLTVTYNPAATTQSGVDWTSSNPAVARVLNGTVTAVAVGEATITAISSANKSISAICTVTVTAAPVPLTGISLNRDSLSLNPDGQGTLFVIYDPADTTEAGVTWATSNPAVARVSNGTVTAVAVGQATITARSTVSNSITANCLVTVTAVQVPLEEIILNTNSLDLHPTDQETLTVTYDPPATTQSGVTWASSNPAVARVSSNGTVTAVAVGQATITATSTVPNSNITASCSVTVTAVPVPLTGISLNTDSLNLIPDGQSDLTVIYEPGNTTDEKGLTWTSNNTNVARVLNGTVTAVAVGEATITAISNVNSTIRASCTVTVTPTPVPLTRISLTPASLNLHPTGQSPLTVIYEPGNTTDAKGLAWTSNNTNVARVSNGTVTAVAVGEATITAISTVNSNIRASCRVTVTPTPVPLTGLRIDPNPLSLVGIGSAGSFEVTYVPSTTTEAGVTWTSGNPNVATVDPATGLVTAVAEGEATITATSTAHPNMTANARVTVSVIPLTGISLPAADAVDRGKRKTLTVTYDPDDSTEKGLIWSTSDDTVATVSGGVVTGVSGGTATITATSTKYSSITDTCEVTVNVRPLTGISLDSAPLALDKGQGQTLTVTYSPSNTTETELTWESSDPDVATVDATGRVTAVGGGNTTITATSARDTSKTATRDVNVRVPLVGISLTPDPLTITGIGSTGSFTVAPIPVDTTESSGVTWSSGNDAVATVDSTTGIITAADGGNVLITATSIANGSITATATVNVVVPLTGISLDGAPLALDKGNQETLTVTYSPSNTTETGVSWSSSNTNAATVDPATGRVTAVGGGNAVITATSTKDTNKTATRTVNVRVPLVGISLTPNPLTITGIGSTGSFTVAYSPEDTTETGVTWTSNNSGVATVDSTTGLITAVNGWNVFITATSTANSGITANAMVSVVVPITGISLDGAPLALNKGDQETLTVTYSPSNTTETGVSWSSSNTNAATVDPATGLVTAVGGGSAVITATSTRDGSKTATRTVNVAVPLTGINLPSAITMGVGQSYLLPAAYIPADTTQTGLTWSSNNASAATVNPTTGLVTADPTNTGTATITATSTGNGGISASCTVTVQANFAGAGIDIVFEGPGDETITLAEPVPAGNMLTVTAPDGYDRYLWYLDSGFYGSTNNPTTSLYPYLRPGLHYLTVIVEKGGEHFSKTLTFRVGY